MGIVAVAVNLAFFGLLLCVEALIYSLGWIPERNIGEGFLYMMDRNLFRFGDIFGLTILAFAMGEILSQAGFPARRYIVVVSVIAVAVTMMMHWIWLYQPIQDSAYPFFGHASLLGYAHLPYFAGHIIWVLLGLRQVNRKVAFEINFLGFLGAVIWLVTVITGI